MCRSSQVWLFDIYISRKILIKGYPNNIHVRPALPSDLYELAFIHSNSCIHTYAKFLPATFLEKRYAHANQLDYFARNLQKRPERQILVGVDLDYNNVLGFIDVGPSGEDCVGKVNSLFVGPKYMHHGIGSCLLHTGEQWLMAHGYKSAILWVFSENGQARKFYQKAGWEDSKMEKPTSWAGLDKVECCRLQKTFQSPSNL